MAYEPILNRPWPYVGAYDNVLILFGFLLNGLIAWYALTWA